MKERIKHLILLIVLIGIDQLTKHLVRGNLMNSDPLDIIPDVLSLQYHENTGAVWGIMSNRIDFLRIFTLVILVIIVFLYFKIPEGRKYKILKLLAVFMMAGAIGNMIDRFFLGHVVDFIYFEIIDFPLFNFADSCLTVSSFVLFFLALFYYKDEDFAFLGKSFRGKKNSTKPKNADIVTEVSDPDEEEAEKEESSDKDSGKDDFLDENTSDIDEISEQGDTADQENRD